MNSHFKKNNDEDGYIHCFHILIQKLNYVILTSLFENLPHLNDIYHFYTTPRHRLRNSFQKHYRTSISVTATHTM